MLLRISRVLILCLGSCLAMSAVAQQFPSKPIRLVVPFPPGGPTDMLARIIAPQMAKQLGQAVIIENRAGAGAGLGAREVAQAAADGYTLLVAPRNALIGPEISKIGESLLRELDGIVALGSAPFAVVVKPESAIKSLSDLKNLAKSKPGGVTLSTAGAGSPSQDVSDLLAKSFGSGITSVPYKSSGEAVSSVVVGNDVGVAMSLSDALRYFHDGKARLLALTSTKRAAAAPGVPTFAELGLPGVTYLIQYFLYAPSKTPVEVKARISSSVLKVMNAELAQAVLRLGIDTKGIVELPNACSKCDKPSCKDCGNGTECCPI